MDTYAYFGDPVYIYSLKEGSSDGFLAPFRVKQIQTTFEYYTSADNGGEGGVEIGRVCEEPDFNTVIDIKEREKKRIEIFMSHINPKLHKVCVHLFPMLGKRRASKPSAFQGLENYGWGISFFIIQA